MKVTLLGSCGAYPAAGEATTGFLIETAHEKVLVDCGSGVLERLQRVIPLEQLTHVFISHYHHDHIADLGVLQYATMITTRQGIREEPLNAFLPLKDEVSFRRYRFDPWWKTTGVTATSQIVTQDLQVTFLATVHPAPCLAMRFEGENHVVTFSADSLYIPELAPFCAGSDLLVCEANFFEGEDSSQTQHLTSVEAGRIARDAHVKRLVLTHLPAGRDHQRLKHEAESVFDGPVALARFGLVVE